MTTGSSFSILPVRLSPAATTRPPSTLLQVKRTFIAESIQRYPGNALMDGSANEGKRVRDLLAKLSVRYDTNLFFCPDGTTPRRLKNLVAALNAEPSGLRLCLSSIIDADSASKWMAMDGCGAIAQIQWRLTGPLPAFGFFRNFSRAGVWNHLILHGTAATPENCNAVARQPNIIHSWEATDSGGNRIFNADDGYRQVAPLAGRPLWQAIEDPVARFVLVACFGKNWLIRSRTDHSGNRLYCIGGNLKYYFCPPDQLPEGYLDEICAMVAAGGTVAATHVKSNLKGAFLIGYAQEGNVIAGNSSLKNPRPAYIDAVRGQSGLDLSGFVERGYTSVRPEYRGLGMATKLLAGLTARAGDRKVFSVIAEGNEATKIIAIRNRTRKVATYFSQKAGKPVGIWMPEWMINSEETP